MQVRSCGVLDGGNRVYPPWRTTLSTGKMPVVQDACATEARRARPSSLRCAHEASNLRCNCNGRLAHIVCATNAATTGRSRAAFLAHHLQGPSQPSRIIYPGAADGGVGGERAESGWLRRDRERGKVRKRRPELLWSCRPDEKRRRAGGAGAH